MESRGGAAVAWDTAFAGLLRFPYRRFAIESQLQPQTAVERLGGIVHQSSFALTALIPSGKLFVGNFTVRHFKIFRVTPYSSRSAALIEGSLAPIPAGTRVDITMRLPRNNQFGAMAWFGIAGLLLCACVLGPVLSPHMGGSASFAGFMLMMIAAGYGILAVSFNRDADASEAILREAMQMQPSERIKEALAPDPVQLKARRAKTARAVVVVAAMFAVFGFLLAPMMLQNSEKFRVARDYVAADATIRIELGEVTSVTADRWRGSQETTSGDRGSATFSLNVAGTNGRGIVAMQMEKSHGKWRVASARLHESSGRTIAINVND